MIHIGKETIDDGSVIIKVDGFLNRETIDPLSEICNQYLEDNLSILLDLAGVTHTDESGRKFLVGLSKHVIIQNVPKFLRID